MRRFFIYATAVIAVTVACASCVKHELQRIAEALERMEELERERQHGGEPADSTESQDSSAAPAPEMVAQYVLYASGVRYEDGYPWRLEQEGEDVRATVFLLRDGQPVVECRTGAEALLGTDPDNHRIAGGHLFADYATDKETILYRDGIEICRWGGRDFVYDVLPAPDDTSEFIVLSGPRSSSGYSVRVSERVVVTDGRQTPTSGFYTDGDALCFNVMDGDRSSVVSFPFSSSMTLGGRNVAGAAVPDGKIIDMCMSGGHLWCLLKGSGNVDSGLYEDGVLRRVVNAGIIDGRILSDGKSVAVAVCTRYSCSVTDLAGNPLMRLSNAQILDCIYDGGKAYALYRDTTVTSVPYVQIGSERVELPRDAVIRYPSSLAVGGGNVALNFNCADGSPALWENGTLSEYGFNGRFTHVKYCVEYHEKEQSGQSRCCYLRKIPYICSPKNWGKKHK